MLHFLDFLPWQKSEIFDGGVVNEKFIIFKMQLRIWNNSRNNPSVSFADSSLYTREPSCETSFFDSLSPGQCEQALPGVSLVIITKKPECTLGKEPKIFRGDKTRLTRTKQPATMDAERTGNVPGNDFSHAEIPFRGRFPAREMGAGK